MPDLRKEILQLINILQNKQGVFGEVNVQGSIWTVHFADGEVWKFTQPMCISHCARCGERFYGEGKAEVTAGLIHDSCLWPGEEVT